MTDIYIVRWKAKTYSLMFGAPEGMLEALDRIGDPSQAEVREIPPEMIAELWLSEDEAGRVELSLDFGDIWRQSPKLVWPLEALGS